MQRRIKTLYRVIFSFAVVFQLFFLGASNFDSPKYVTISEIDRELPFRGMIIKVTPEDADYSVHKVGANWSVIQFGEAGFFGITVNENGYSQFYSVFVSPVPTKHSDDMIEGMNWYQTQFNSGTLSNCGPASCAMAISWATRSFFPTYAVREAVGWKGDGSTSFDDLLRVIKKKNITASILPLSKFDNIKKVIDEKGIAIVLFKTDGVASTKMDPKKHFFNKYYVDNVGHYIIVKGYSKDGKYLVVNDPIPSDWAGNTFRHNDGLSMIGKNRYYLTSELLSSLRTPLMIAVWRSK